MSLKNKIYISRLKTYALKLRAGKQLPLVLVQAIMAIDHNTKIEVIDYLKVCCEKYLRVKGYYSKYVSEDDIISKDIKEKLQLMDFII